MGAPDAAETAMTDELERIADRLEAELHAGPPAPMSRPCPRADVGDVERLVELVRSVVDKAPR